MMEITGYIALIAVGVLLGLTGGGGSMLSVPILVYLFSLDIFQASAYSFFVVGTASTIGAWQKKRANLIDKRAAVLFGVPSLVATFCTRQWIIPSVPHVVFETGNLMITKTELFLSIFALLTLASGVMILLRVNAAAYNDERPRAPLFHLFVAGAATGAFAGLGGIGGGFLILPALLLFDRMPFKTAAGTALLIVAANSLSGFLGDICHHRLDWFFLISITCLAVGGIVIGNLSSHLVSSRQLQRLVAWFTMLLGVSILWVEWRV